MHIKIGQQNIELTKITHQKLRLKETHELDIRANLIFKLVGGREKKKKVQRPWWKGHGQRGENRWGERWQNLRRDNKELGYTEGETTDVPNLRVLDSEKFFVTVSEIERLLKNKHKRPKQQKQNPESFPCYSVSIFKIDFQ